MAADSGTFRHNPGTLKQQNKVHKHGKHKTKGQMDRETKGRVNIKVLTKKSKHVQRKNDRRYQAQQLRKQKREEVLAKKRNRGGHGTPPYFVVIVALDKTVDTKAVMDLLKTCDETLVVDEQNEQGIQHITVPRFKQRLSFYCPPCGDLYALLDAAKIADCLLCVLSTDRGIDDYGEQCLSCLFGQGLPSVTLALQGLKTLPQKKQHEVRKFVQKKLEKRFPSEKFHSLDSIQDAVLVMRQITSHKLRPIYYRECRPHLVAEKINFEVENSDSMTGTLKLTGYLRGCVLSVNGLVHLPGWGNFQMLQIDASEDPHPLNSKNKPRKKITESQDVEMDSRDEAGAGDKVRILERADPSCQQSLQSEVVPDLMDGEQTWPTEEELAQAEAEIHATKKIVKRVPKGTSEYQAAWICDSEDEWELE
ncbi:hypothetical protein CHS0354_035687 [Potamilus streckersoni]|uniref:Bms1-type G domain-containing protein n=1 Tax=Potamilus streckersoni TaxID=2493646 RepID=A0AAE0RSN4_9BIVA|nr:hypothetical protein CHS0354_035687 [Potamilus streckersoni]